MQDARCKNNIDALEALAPPPALIPPPSSPKKLCIAHCALCINLYRCSPEDLLCFFGVVFMTTNRNKSSTFYITLTFSNGE